MFRLGRLRGIAIAGALAVVGVEPARALDGAGAKAAAPSAKAAPSAPARAAEPPALEKTILAENVPTARTEFSVSPDGKRSYFAEGLAYYVFDENGDAIARMPTRGQARTLALLPDGRFISAQTHAGGHVALLGTDAVELRSLVTRGASPQSLRADKTNWTTPVGLAVDSVHQLMFVLDTTVAPAGTPDPDWSRIAVFDTAGKYLRGIAAYDASKAPATDEHRTWYDDIEVDPKRSIVYVTARTPKQLWAFNYDGTPVGRAPGVAGIAVLPNGNVAVVDPDRHHVRVYDRALQLAKTLSVVGVLDLEADAAGRLYASVADPTILYLRWPPSLSEPDAVRPKFQHLAVRIPFDASVAGAPFSLSVAVTGRPTPSGDAWHVFARPSDGSDLSWKELDSTYTEGALNVRPPADLRGLNDIAVRYGKGAIASGDLHVEKTVRFAIAADGGSASVRSVLNRAGFQRGEAIAIRIDGATSRNTAALTLQRAGKTLGSSNISLATRYWELPSAVTRRLVPGHYVLNATVDSLQAIPYEFDIAEAEPDSPMQRILYHEFETSEAPLPQNGLPSIAERLAFVRAYTDSVAGLGFTRETDRSALRLMRSTPAGAWRTDAMTEPAAHDVLPLGGLWEPEFYLDRATALGIHYDTQLLAHCSGVRLADSWFPPLNATLQRLSQWLGRYPSFYGFNYNDEAFFPNGPFVNSIPADQAWLDSAAAQLVGRPKADAFRLGFAHMYSQFDAAVKEVKPDLARTTTPMWQYPAVVGSYAPTVYAHMTESYSHYLSEGYGWPWYPAHSADMLRRPGLPLMGVFDNGYLTGDGESFLKDALQVLGRGVQGIGLEHHRPLREPQGSNALRLMNGLAQMYGPIFAEAEPDNEATVLYSYAQDVSEQVDNLGTPHWERVFALYGAGLMAGLPMSTTYEEDIAAGALLEHGKPKVKLLFLVGQTAELPAPVKAALLAFSAAGGRVVIDADSREFPGATRFPHALLGPIQASQIVRDGDPVFPAAQPGYEATATALSAQFGPGRRFPVDTDDLWVSKNRFDGGAIHYVLIASETSPYPWDAASVWNLGAKFNKSYWPKSVRLSVPQTPVIYDVFERRIAAAKTNGNSSVVQADLTTFPGKFYALAPRALSAPKLSARVSQSDVTYTVDVGMPARVPLRLVLSDSHGATTTLYRGTNLRGEFEHTIARPVGTNPWRLEVSELLGGASSSLTIPAAELAQPLVRPLADVETEREPQIRALLAKASRNLHVVGANTLPTELRASLLRTLKTKGVQATVESTSAPSASPATYLLFGTTSSKNLVEPAQTANQVGLFGRRLSDVYPGPGRGFVSAAYAARVYGENCIAIVGGDQPGLNAATARFIGLLGEPTPKAVPSIEKRDQPPPVLLGAPAPRVDIPPLSERVGVRLSGIRAIGGKLALSANGYLGNLARVDDEGDHGRVVAVARIGGSPVTASLFLSNDGESYGLAARTLQRFGLAFSLSNANSPTPDSFTSFGDAPPYLYGFSASGDGSTVLAPGPYGVVAWQRSAGRWREAWSIDYWKKFDSMEWPMAANALRIPGFYTLVPKHGNVALITFADLTDGWLESGTRPTAQVMARSLKDGTTRWHFTEPPSGTHEAVNVYSNSDGSEVVFQTQLGGAGAVRYYALDQGRITGIWGSGEAPLGLQIADHTGRVVAAYGGGSRLLEVRLPDGSLVFGKIWHAQPMAVSFAEDGASVFVSDDAGALSRLDPQGNLVWQVQLGCSAELAQDGAQLYAAGWDGRLRAFTSDGHERWKLDLTGPMTSAAIQGRGAPTTSAAVHEPKRSAGISTDAPSGVNLLRSGQATLTVGGTRGWKSNGAVEIDASTLTNGNVEDNDTPWMSTGELFWDGTGSRKVWAELDLKQPTTVHTLTVYENPKFPESWPTESLIQVWDDANGRWRTAKHAVFLRGSRATYVLNLKRVSKLRYVPWANYFINFHTSEIELR
jgi:hypothetical protein